MERLDVFRLIAILVLIAAVIAALPAANRHPTAVTETAPPSPAAEDDLSTELRRCGARGPQDAGDARCVAVWEENRRRFFGKPARPLPPETIAPGARGNAAPITPSTGDAP